MKIRNRRQTILLGATAACLVLAACGSEVPPKEFVNAQDVGGNGNSNGNAAVGGDGTGAGGDAVGNGTADGSLGGSGSGSSGSGAGSTGGGSGSGAGSTTGGGSNSRGVAAPAAPHAADQPPVAPGAVGVTRWRAHQGR